MVAEMYAYDPSECKMTWESRKQREESKFEHSVIFKIIIAPFKR